MSLTSKLHKLDKKIEEMADRDFNFEMKDFLKTRIDSRIAELECLAHKLCGRMNDLPKDKFTVYQNALARLTQIKTEHLEDGYLLSSFDRRMGNLDNVYGRLSEFI